MKPSRRTGAGVVLACGLFITLAVAAPAATSIRPAPGAADPKAMVLTPADLGGAKITKQHYYKDKDFPSVVSYSREFDGGRAGSSRLSDVDSEAEVGTSAPSTANFVRSLRLFYSSKAARKSLAKSFAAQAGEGLVTLTAIGHPRNLGVGPGSFDLLITLRVLGQRTDLHIAVFRVERVLDGVIVLGEPGKPIPLSVMTYLAKAQAARTSAELRPRNTALPVISGTAVAGQTLAATPGTWSGGPTSFGYQWQRCDASGNGCGDIAGATGPSYVLADADVGSTIRVVVTGRSSLGSATATSAPTPVVSASGAPTSTSPPTIAGAAQVGQTLAAVTGSWTDSPTSFGFQWQRCDGAGNGCTDIAGATSGTYLVGAGDRGSTLRVVVTARNAAGSATAVSAPTSVVT